MLKKSLSIFMVTGVVAGFGLATGADEAETVADAQEVQKTQAPSDAAAPLTPGDLFEPEVLSSPAENADELPAILGGGSVSGVEMLGWRPRPCWCCKFCCCIT